LKCESEVLLFESACSVYPVLVEVVFSGLVSLCIHVVTKMFTDDPGIEMSKQGSGDRD